jgi:predicted aconitase with swiveling domain
MTTTALVCGEISRSTASGSIVGSSRLTMSAKTGVAPAATVVFAAATKLMAGWIISSPAPIPRAR